MKKKTETTKAQSSESHSDLDPQNPVAATTNPNTRVCNPTNKQLTVAPVCVGDLSHTLPEFGRCLDCTRLFGLKRGTLYNLLSAGRIRGVLLRVKGQKSGVRLFDLNSVRSFIGTEMNKEGGTL